MTHEDIKVLISVYIDNEANAQERKLVEDHCAICEECRKELAQFRNISLSLKEVPQERLSPDVDLKLKAHLGPTKERPMEKQASEIQWSAVGVLVALLTVSLLGIHQYAQRGLQARFHSATDDLGDQFLSGSAYMSSTGKSGQVGQLALGKTTQYEPYYLSSNYAVTRQVPEEKSLKSQEGLKYRTVERLSKVEQSKGNIGDQFHPGNTSMTNDRSMDNIPAAMVQGGMGLVGAKKDYRQQLALADTAQYEPYYLRSSYSVDRKTKEVDKLYRRDVLQEAEGRLAAAPAAAEVYAVEPARMMAPAQKYEFRSGDEDRSYVGYNQMIYPAPQPTDTESYDRIYENAFLNPVNAPLSTFSIDVDTASYSNVRRFLAQGQLPPADAVRIEELVNYFSYDYPEPMWGQPFSITTEVAPCPWNPAHQLALIGLQGKRLNGFAMPASNLVFLIDVSGSMDQPNKLPLLQDAFRMMTQELEGKDKVSIVVYAGAAGLVLDATSGNFKDRILTAIDRLRAGGSTAGGDGIRLAYQVARDHFIANGNNRVILATDGDFNVGISNDNDLVRMIEDYRDQGIFLTVLGFGEGNLKDSKMEKLADHGNGNYFYIDNLNEAHKVLVHELGSTLFTIAKDVKVQVEFNPATVSEYRLVGYENRMLAKEDFNDDTKDAGELGAGHTVTALYEIVPVYPFYGDERTNGVDPLVYQKNPQVIRGNSSDVMTVKLRYKDPKATVSKLIKKTVSRRDVNPYIQSDNLRFASAVAEFGLLLRNSPYRGQASFEHVLTQARASKTDEFGYRAEFIGLAERARSLSPYISPMPVDGPVVYENDQYKTTTGKGQK